MFNSSRSRDSGFFTWECKVQCRVCGKTTLLEVGVGRIALNQLLLAGLLLAVDVWEIYNNE